MAVLPLELRLSEEQRGALALLASIPYRIMEDRLVLVHGFNCAVLAGLIDDGLATARSEVVAAGRAVIEVVRIRIIDAGLRAIER